MINLKRASTSEVQSWLFSSIRDLTPYQKEWIRNEEIIRFSPFYFMKEKKKVNNIFLRLTIIFIPFVFLFLTIGLIFNFFITGVWGFSDKKIAWYSEWISSCGL